MSNAQAMAKTREVLQQGQGRPSRMADLFHLRRDEETQICHAGHAVREDGNINYIINVIC
jgi:hypothetical protein